jgi:branched-chain amino acid transport system substrate-binding protein
LVEALQAKKQDPSGPFVWTSYAAVQALAAGIAKAGDEPAEVVKTLKADKVATVMGDLQWDEKGDLKGFEFGVFAWHKDGSSSTAK